MEEELVQSHMDVDRVIAVRADPDGTLRYLVKVRGRKGKQKNPPQKGRKDDLSRSKKCPRAQSLAHARPSWHPAQ